MPELMRDREILPDRRVPGIDSYDGMMSVAIKKARHVAFQRVNVDARSF